MKFNITDVVSLKGFSDLLYVTGVIHDDKRLFVTGADGKEIEVTFKAIDEQWVKKES